MKKLLLNSKSLVIAFVIANLFLFSTASAQKTWDGGAGTQNWGDGNNWNPNGVPTATDAVTLINNTTVNVDVAAVGASLTFPSGNAANVNLNINAGFSLAITGAVTIPRANGAAVNTLAVGTGSLSAGSIAFTNGGGGVRHLLTISTGTVTTGNVTQVGSTGSASITFTGAGLLKVSGTFLTITTGTLTQGTGTVEYNGAAAQTVGNFTYNNLTLSGGGNKTIPAATTVNGKLSMQGTAAAITNAPVYGAGATLEYAGSAAQTATAIEFPAATGPTNLIINNANGVTLLNAVRTITGTLTLTSGILTIPAAATPNLIISTGTVIGGAPFSAAKHIKTATSGATTGLIRVNSIATSSVYTFPVGDGTNYLPVILNSANTVANNSFSVSAFNGITIDGLPNGTAFTAIQKNTVVDAVWTINYNGTGTPTAPLAVSITLAWPATLEGAGFSANPNPLIGIAHYGPAAWGTCIGSGDNVANTAINTNVTTFSPFGVGTISGSGSPLAIKVYYFNADKVNGINKLNWSAACGSTQATFEIERSTDGRNFTAINAITASQARCAMPFSYDDNSSIAGTVYYRIKIIDNDGGRINYTSIVKVGSQQKDIQLAGISPNPVSNTAQLNVTTTKKDNVALAIISLEGKVVYRSNVQLQSGSSIISVDVSNLAKGTYFVRGVFGDGQTNTIKFIK